MEKRILSPEDTIKLHSHVVKMLMTNGFKSTTMDAVASELGMSKRTLYEIFSSKDDMLRQSLESLSALHKESIRTLVLATDNAMEGLIKAFVEHLRFFNSTNIKFFRDLDRLYSHLRGEWERSHREQSDIFFQYLQRGEREGVFRSDVDYRIYIRLLEVQMESLKRVEEDFPADITLVRAMGYIFVGFLRSIATPNGMLLIDKYLPSLIQDHLDDPKISNLQPQGNNYPS